MPFLVPFSPPISRLVPPSRAPLTARAVSVATTNPIAGRGRGGRLANGSADRWRTMDRILAGGSGGSAELTGLRAASDYLSKRTAAVEARAPPAGR